MTDFLTTDAGTAGLPPFHLLLAHGAGAAMDSPFMEQFAVSAAERGISVHRFEFAYMAGRRTGGSRRPPPPIAQLCTDYRGIVAEWRQRYGAGATLMIGGKSMGGRAASMIADELHADRLVDGLVCLGYPFHPQGRPERLRTEHLAAMACPALIVQGERDPLGSRSEIEAYELSGAINVTYVGDGDHDFGPRGRSGFTKSGNIREAAAAVEAFAAKVAMNRT